MPLLAPVISATVPSSEFVIGFPSVVFALGQGGCKTYSPNFTG
jgi:hypothetical protein